MISYMFHIVYGAGAPGALSSQPHPYHHFGWLLHPEAESCQASMLRQHGPGGGGGYAGVQQVGTDSTGGPLAARDPHVSPTVWRDDGDP